MKAFFFTEMLCKPKNKTTTPKKQTNKPTDKQTEKQTKK